MRITLYLLLMLLGFVPVVIAQDFVQGKRRPPDQEIFERTMRRIQEATDRGENFVYWIDPGTRAIVFSPTREQMQAVQLETAKRIFNAPMRDPFKEPRKVQDGRSTD